MADDKNAKAGLDDWDNMPLDPDADDDWDQPATPPPAKKSPAPETGPDDKSVELDDFGDPIEPESAPGQPADAELDDFDEPVQERPQAAASAALDDFDGPVETEDAPPQPADAEPDDFDEPVQERPQAASAALDDFDEPVEAEDAPPEPADAEPDDFDEPLETPPQDLAADGAGEPAVGAETPHVGDDLLPKKVELDIEGMFFENAEKPAEEGGGDEAETPAEPPAEDQPAAPAEGRPETAAEPAKLKKNRLKLLIFAAPAALVLGGLGFAAYKLFLGDPPPPPPQTPVLIEAPPAPHVARPGEFALGTFYLNIPGDPHDAIIAMEVSLHYNDAPDLAAIKDRRTVLRDLVYRLSLSKGADLAADPGLQNALRMELLDEINRVLGQTRINYVQISSPRLL